LTARQPERSRSLARAAATFDYLEAVGELMPVADPSLAGHDSLWAAGVKGLAGALLDEGLENANPDPDLAGVWLRWGVRHAGALPVDPIYDPEALRSAYDRAVAAVAPDPESEAGVATDWTWSSAFDPSAEGRLLVTLATATPNPPTLTVDGRPWRASAAERLPPGTHRIGVSGEGWEEWSVEREVLPGVITHLQLEPVPVLSPRVEARVERGIVQLRYQLNGAAACANGLAVGPSAVVVRPGVLDLDGLEWVGPSPASGPAGPSAQSEGDDLGVIRASAAGAAAWPSAAAQPGAYAWAIYRSDCAGPLLNERVRVERIDATEAVFDRPVAETAVGGALVDWSGGLIGIVSTAERATLLTGQAQQFLEQAIVAMNEEESAGNEGGRPWKWIGGAGAVGGLALLLVGGGSDTTPKPTGSGTIIVVLPEG
jgi:hypothetical protein